ncbi:MAG: hypothetical protein KKF33_20380 [Alphaproteobacteria bacterium]|nr:hypothetical protein [Alphaproteobacteria bacterium]
MALNVKPIEAASTKWTDNASRAAGEYAANAAASAEDWARKTAASMDTYGQAISAPGIKNRFRVGVVKAGAAKYARKINDVARDRFGPGVAAAKDDYKSGAEPYYTLLAGLTLSPRKPKGDPSNYQRVEQVGKALNAKRLAMLGSGGG